MNHVLRIHPTDNVLVALRPIDPGVLLQEGNDQIQAVEAVEIKHKLATEDIPVGGIIRMYGTTVGVATRPIYKGMKITTGNTRHETARVHEKTEVTWHAPDISNFRNWTFNGYHRKNGKVGTRNYWIFVPLVFCENRNIKALEDALLEPLGYPRSGGHNPIGITDLLAAARRGETEFESYHRNETSIQNHHRVFPNVDGIKFLTHESGCGCTRQDSDMLCKLIASYVTHPNVGGATILSLGCQNAEVQTLQNYIRELDPSFDRPVFYFEQQTGGSEQDFLFEIIRSTFKGLAQANKEVRKPASMDHLSLGLECGGSDGFSGISANPALGFCSDLLVALGGTAILSEFPELHGAEQDIVNRSIDNHTAQRFLTLMEQYNRRAKESGSGFEANPSPGNIRDGLITDAIKSLGAAKKGGTSPITDVLDYGEVIQKKGLNLLCTPGNDVESTTGLAGAGSNMIVFTTGLGTPTGNAICPTIKVSTNSALASRMADIIDINAGTIIDGSASIEQVGTTLLEYIRDVASGMKQTKAEILGQDDFIPWKRGISL